MLCLQQEILPEKLVTDEENSRAELFSHLSLEIFFFWLNYNKHNLERFNPAVELIFVTTFEAITALNKLPRNEERFKCNLTYEGLKMKKIEMISSCAKPANVAVTRMNPS